eukprot:CAMPEP_0168355444 /NCGR_PEP_ID=MMETSP0213-20121227/24549_1 /TAXON_ID=151035 /ORGANISM="Euplotes harpa, Strain FSP1.4" /LENGTH=112 /DNA_ID=CAMNT_0008367645 /DNA_START=77 /DNA_END=415 /DNA_ORIENTATION=+
MNVIKAISGRNNEPDGEASEVLKRGKKKGPIAIQNQSSMPVVNFSINSLIQVGAFNPPIINTLIVNENNYIASGSDPVQYSDPKISKSIRDFVTASKEILKSSQGSNKVISK